jgi:DNA replication protein DnaC
MPLSLMGRVMYPQKVCGPCIEKGREEERRLDALQRQHVSKLEGQDRELTLRKLLHDLGANPWEHGHASLDNFDPGDSPKALGAAREFANAVKAAGKYDPVRGLYLWGETGPGKTHLAVGVVRWLLEEDYRGDIVFDHAASLIARIQDTYGRKDERTMSVLEKRVHAGLWILDDFGTERPSDDVIRHMTVIFAERAMRPTLVTSTSSPDRMDRDRPDMMRVLSRLGPKYFRTVEVKGRDRRFD